MYDLSALLCFALVLVFFYCLIFWLLRLNIVVYLFLFLSIYGSCFVGGDTGESQLRISGSFPLLMLEMRTRLEPGPTCLPVDVPETLLLCEQGLLGNFLTAAGEAGEGEEEEEEEEEG